MRVSITSSTEWKSCLAFPYAAWRNRHAGTTGSPWLRYAPCMVKAADHDSTGRLIQEANRRRCARLVTLYRLWRAGSQLCVVQIHAAAFIVGCSLQWERISAECGLPLNKAATRPVG